MSMVIGGDVEMAWRRKIQNRARFSFRQLSIQKSERSDAPDPSLLRSTYPIILNYTNSTFTAVTLYSGILATGSRAACVNSLAEASGKWKLV